MLSWANKHILRGLHIYYRRLARVGVWHPYMYGEAISRAAKGNWDGPAEEEQKRRSSILIS